MNVASVQPRPPVRYRNVRRFTLSYTLPDGASSDIRIRPSVVIVPIWSFGTQGSVRVRLPSDYEVLVDGDPLRAEQDGSAWQLESGPVPDPSRWLARITATLPSSYVTAERQVALSQGSVDLQVRSWSDDPAWGRRTLRLLTDALPRLDEAIGLPYRPTGPLVIVESLPESGTVLREPAASDADIAIGYTEPAFTVLHQVAHLWLPATLVGDRWIREGFASHAAAQVARTLDVDLPIDPAARCQGSPRRCLPAGQLGRRRGNRRAGSLCRCCRLGRCGRHRRRGGGGRAAIGVAAHGGRARRLPAAVRRRPDRTGGCHRAGRLAAPARPAGCRERGRCGADLPPLGPR